MTLGGGNTGYLEKFCNSIGLETDPNESWRKIKNFLKPEGQRDYPALHHDDKVAKINANKVQLFAKSVENRKSDLILIMTPEKQDKTLELSKHWSVDSTLARNEVIMKRTYPVKSVKCDKICSNY